jgi:thymidylate synthase (FAD)
MGYCAGVCWGADVSDDEKNYKRGLDCIKSGHGRVLDYVNVEMILKDYSAKVIREWYTHIGGMPARLQSSTRYINYDNFNYIIPYSIEHNNNTLKIYQDIMNNIINGYKQLLECGIKKEDASMVLPFGMETIVMDKRDLRSLVDMSRQRMCSRAYWEYRKLFNHICKALSEYSEEWKTIVKMCFHPKCEEVGYCTEKNSCGKMPKQLDKV